MSIYHRIGIFGGTFDPIHEAHVKIVKKAYEEFFLDKVIIMPNGLPPHKSGTYADMTDRLSMTRIGVEGLEFVHVSDLEIRRKDKSYLYESLEIMSGQYREAVIYFILGSDSLLDIENWKNPKKIMELAHLIVYPRDEERDRLMYWITYLREKYEARISLMEVELMDISSSKIRESLTEGKIPEGLNPKVYDYIIGKGIYGTGSN